MLLARGLVAPRRVLSAHSRAIRSIASDARAHAARSTNAPSMASHVGLFRQPRLPPTLARSPTLSHSAVSVPARHMTTLVRLVVVRLPAYGLGLLGVGAAGANAYDSIRNSFPTLPDMSPYTAMASDLLEDARRWSSEMRDRAAAALAGSGDGPSGPPGGSNMNPLRAAATATTVAARPSEDETPADSNKGVADAKRGSGSDKGKTPATQPDPELERLRAELADMHDAFQRELLEVQNRMQHEIDSLQRENTDLRASYLGLKQKSQSRVAEGSGSIIEMYAEVLDMLSTTDKRFNVHDNLPRVVVVGDQSAGKTSVLEMIAQARIFPRGGGEMMTRSPIQVTLSESPDRRARFSNSDREYDLNREADLADLRSEIEKRMVASVARGATVSRSTVSLSVRGPGLPRMVLVDLPGIIGHITAGMAEDTKSEILDMCKHHMQNPNAIILCVQDGSVDAERSNVADVVNTVDPTGKRTIFVLTKVDLAEQMNANPQKVKRILEGRLFKMNALGYFAVVTGRGGQNEDSIEDIRRYEEEYFRNSKLFRSGALKANQMTTGNLSRAVAREFWKQVRSSVERQSDIIRADLYNKETEWKNSFKGRVMSRDEVFQLGKHEILESVASFGRITAKEWEELLMSRVWTAVASHVVEDVYLGSARTGDPSDFQTKMDLGLSEWARAELPQMCSRIGREAFIREFAKVLQDKATDVFPDSNEVFGKLKTEVKDKASSLHQWQSDVVDNLSVIQSNVLSDQDITDRKSWENATVFMEKKLGDYAKDMDAKSRAMFGPSTRESWTGWKYPTKDQVSGYAVRSELVAMLSKSKMKPELDRDELATIRNNVKKSYKIDIDDEKIRTVNDHLYRESFLQKSRDAAVYCRSRYNGSAPDAPNGLQCRDVVLFWRMNEMLGATGKTLRQQVMVHKGKLEREVKGILDTISADLERKRELVGGRRVELAEQIEITRFISAKLEQFIQQLQRESLA
eukprot:Opistho-2@24364